MFIHGWSSLGLTVMDMDICMPDAGSVNTEMHTNGFNRDWLTQLCMQT